MDGRKDAITGTIDLQYSLKHLLGKCTDFKDEQTALQFFGTQLGVMVILIPKFHAELAAEGVEYSWAHAKAYYRRMPESRKRGRDKFKQLVKECTCPINVLTKERIEKFASRAQACICTYRHLEQQQQLQTAAAVAELEEEQNFTATTTGSTSRGMQPIDVSPKQELLYKI